MATIFETKRFIIREYQPSEMRDWIDLLTHPEVGKYLPKRSPEQWESIFIANMESYGNGTGLGRWAVADKQTNKVMGNAMLAPAREGLSGYELGYAFEKEYWGTGAGTEVVTGIINYGFDGLGINAICAITSPANIGSARVLEKAGFKSSGIVNLGTEDLLLFEIEKN